MYKNLSFKVLTWLLIYSPIIITKYLSEHISNFEFTTVYTHVNQSEPFTRVHGKEL